MKTVLLNFLREIFYTRIWNSARGCSLLFTCFERSHAFLKQHFPSIFLLECVFSLREPEIQQKEKQNINEQTCVLFYLPRLTQNPVLHYWVPCSQKLPMVSAVFSLNLFWRKPERNLRSSSYCCLALSAPFWNLLSQKRVLPVFSYTLIICPWIWLVTRTFLIIMNLILLNILNILLCGHLWWCNG